jgi:hypothetical protein
VVARGEDGGTVYVDIVPDASKFAAKLKGQVESKADRIGQDIGKQIAARISDGIRSGLDRGLVGAAPKAKATGRKSGDDFAGEFDRTVRTKIQAALRSLPPAKIGVSATAAEQKIKDLRVDLERLSSKEVGVDIDATAALAEINRIRFELQRVGSESPNIAVRVETARAASQLMAIDAEIRRVDGRDVDVRVDADTAGAQAQLAGIDYTARTAHLGIASLIAAGIGIGPAIVPAAAAAVAAIGAIGPVAVSGAMGLGVLALGFSGVIGAVKAMSQEEDKAGASASTLASRQNRLESSSDQLANAEDSLRAAHNALRAAQDRAREAQEALTGARKAAKEADEDLASQVANGVLAQRRAVLDLAAAKADVESLGPEKPGETDDTKRQRAEAQLRFDEAKQQNVDLELQQKRLVDAQKESQRVGIEGSPQVVAAQDAIAQANGRVEQANQQIVQATRAVAAAQRAGSAAAISAAGGAAGGVDKVALAMAGLSPAGQEFARFIYGLKPVFGDLRQAAESALLPAIQAGIEAFLPAMPAITDAVVILATALGELFKQGLTALASPFWIDFITQMALFGAEMIKLSGPIIGGFLRGLAGIILAFTPFSQQIGEGLARLMTRFAEFGAGLANNPSFQKFIDYVLDNGPLLLSVFADLAVAVTKLLIALAPVGTTILLALAEFLGWLSSLDPAQVLGVFYAIIAVVGAVAIAFGFIQVAVVAGIAALVALVGIAIYAYRRFETFRNVVDTVASAWWSFAQTMASVYLWIWDVLKNFLAAIQPVFSVWWSFAQTMAGAYLWAWGVLQTVWDAITVVFQAAWAFIQPVLDAIAFMIQNVLVPWFLYLYENVIMPVWQGIQLAISVAWAIIKVIFGIIQIQLKILADTFIWLWHNILEPVWRGIAAVIGYVWESKLKPIFVVLGGFIKEYVVPAFKAGVDALGKAWEAIRDLAKVPIKFVIETVLNNGILSAYNKLAKLFKVKPDNVQIPMPAGFATGGSIDRGLIRGPGSGTSDSILARVAGGPMIRVSNGEYIIPENIVRRYGVGFFDQMIGKPWARRPGDGSEGLAFAGGGILDFAGDMWDAVSNPGKLVKDPIDNLIARIPGGAWARDIAAGTMNKLVGGLIDWVKGAGGDGSNVGKTRAFLQAQRGKPYIWASAGPDGYDCSGLVSAAWNVMHGRNPYSHTFSTMNQAPFFPKPGHGIFTAGWANAGERGGGSVGHTAGLLAGMGFESRGGDGVVIGSGTTSVDSFAHVGTFDRGGYLPPGLTLAYNGTNRPEAVLTGGQLADLKTSRDEIHFHGTGAGIQDVQAWMDRRDALARYGRPR